MKALSRRNIIIPNELLQYQLFQLPFHIRAPILKHHPSANVRERSRRSHFLHYNIAPGGPKRPLTSPARPYRAQKPRH